jgi:hypothetical protein
MLVAARGQEANLMTERKAPWARPATDPTLPPRLRALAGRQGEVTSRTARWLSAAAPGVRASVLACWSASAALVGTAIANPLPAVYPDMWLALAGAAAGLAAAMGLQFSPVRELAESGDRIVCPHELDGPCRIILAKAQSAIETTLRSEIRAAGLLEADEPTLRRHEWEIATALRRVTDLRAIHAEQRPAGSMTVRVLESQQRALDVAQEATAARVAALERFAARVAAADAAYRDWRDALQLSGLNDKYLDLVAATAADETAIAELAELSDRAAITASALQDSLHAASQSAELLAI